jgi:hypothetical protein
MVDETVAFQIPQGYKLDYIPENFSSEQSNWGLSVRYEQRGALVILHRKYFFELLMLEPEKFAPWNQWIKQGINAARENIVLRKEK